MVLGGLFGFRRLRWSTFGYLRFLKALVWVSIWDDITCGACGEVTKRVDIVYGFLGLAGFRRYNGIPRKGVDRSNVMNVVDARPFSIVVLGRWIDSRVCCECKGEVWEIGGCREAFRFP